MIIYKMLKYSKIKYLMMTLKYIQRLVNNSTRKLYLQKKKNDTDDLVISDLEWDLVLLEK